MDLDFRQFHYLMEQWGAEHGVSDDDEEENRGRGSGGVSIDAL